MSVAGLLLLSVLEHKDTPRVGEIGGRHVTRRVWTCAVAAITLCEYQRRVVLFTCVRGCAACARGCAACARECVERTQSSGETAVEPIHHFKIGFTVGHPKNTEDTQTPYSKPTPHTTRTRNL